MKLPKLDTLNTNNEQRIIQTLLEELVLNNRTATLCPAKGNSSANGKLQNIGGGYFKIENEIFSFLEVNFFEHINEKFDYEIYLK